MKVALGAGVGFLCGVVLVVVLALSHGDDGASSATGPRPAPQVVRVVVPDVVGSSLDDAGDRLARKHFKVEHKGGGLFGVVVESNWVVQAQRPAAGTRARRGATVQLFVDRR